MIQSSEDIKKERKFNSEFQGLKNCKSFWTGVHNYKREDIQEYCLDKKFVEENYISKETLNTIGDMLITCCDSIHNHVNASKKNEYDWKYEIRECLEMMRTEALSLLKPLESTNK